MRCTLASPLRDVAPHFVPFPGAKLFFFYTTHFLLPPLTSAYSGSQTVAGFIFSILQSGFSPHYSCGIALFSFLLCFVSPLCSPPFEYLSPPPPVTPKTLCHYSLLFYFALTSRLFRLFPRDVFVFSPPDLFPDSGPPKVPFPPAILRPFSPRLPNQPYFETRSLLWNKLAGSKPSPFRFPLLVTCSPNPVFFRGCLP